PQSPGRGFDPRRGAEAVVVAGRSLVVLDLALRVHFSDRPGLVVQAAALTDAGGPTGAGRAAAGLVGGDVGAVEIQDRVGVGGDQRAGGGGGAVEEAGALGGGPGAARAPRPAP